jgi:MFS family permease
MLESFGLAAVAFLAAGYNVKPPPHTVTIILWWLIALSMFQGLVNAFDVPGRQSFVIRLVDRREDLPNAIALNSSMFNAARLIGPAIAGILIWRVGEAWCFTIDGFSYLAVIIALLMMRVDEGARPTQHRHILVEMREGIRYATGFAPITALIALLAVASFASTPIMILMPRFATQVLHGNSLTQGLLTSSVAAGALIGALRLAARKSVVGLGRQLPFMTVGLGLSMIAFGFSTAEWFSMLALVGVGFCTMTQMASCNTLLQTLVEDHMRGRVMSLFTMAFMGMVPLGSLSSGQLAAVAGPAKTAAAGGGLCIIAGLAFATRLPKLRELVYPVFVQRGILPKTATALAATDAAVEESAKQ